MGDHPGGIAIGDLNEDGWSDLVVANARDTTLSVLLGRGDGSFGPRTDFSAGTAVGSVAIADLSGDGHLDVTATAATHNRVLVFFGLGDGTLGSRTDCATGRAPVDVDIGDLNGDGWPDLATANAGHIHGGGVSVILGTGNGGFASATTLIMGRWPNAVAIRDLNADGRPDLTVTDDGSSVYVLLGQGDGTFLSPTPFSAGNFALSLATDDLNGDGRLDAAVAVYPNRVAVLLGNGEGALGPPREFAAASPRRVAMADLNADGRIDLAATNWDSDSNSVSVLLGNGDGTFGPRTDYPAGTRCLSVEVGDFNGDGRPDLAVTNASSNTVSVLLNRAAVATGVSLASAWAEPGLARVVWYADDMPNLLAVVERRTEAAEWRTGSTMTPDGTRRLILEDRRIEPGVRYGYRLRINVDGRDEFVGEVWLEVPRAPGPEPGPGPGPGTAFALHGFVPNPAEGELAASFSLPDDRPASLELFDVAGRRVWSWDVGPAGPGSHWIRLGARGTPPGVYVLRLTRGAEVLTARGLLLK